MAPRGQKTYDLVRSVHQRTETLQKQLQASTAAMSDMLAKQNQLQAEVLREERAQTQLVREQESRRQEQQRLRDAVFEVKSIVETVRQSTDSLAQVLMLESVQRMIERNPIHPRDLHELADKEFARQTLELLAEATRDARACLTEADLADLHLLRTAAGTARNLAQVEHMEPGAPGAHAQLARILEKARNTAKKIAALRDAVSPCDARKRIGTAGALGSLALGAALILTGHATTARLLGLAFLFLVFSGLCGDPVARRRRLTQELSELRDEESRLRVAFEAASEDDARAVAAKLVEIERKCGSVVAIKNDLLDMKQRHPLLEPFVAGVLDDVATAAGSIDQSLSSTRALTVRELPALPPLGPDQGLSAVDSPPPQTHVSSTAGRPMRKADAIAAVRDLIQSTTVETIVPAQITEILSRADLTLESARDELVDVYSAYVRVCLRNGRLASQETEELERIKDLFGLPGSVVAAVHEEAGAGGGGDSGGGQRV